MVKISKLARGVVSAVIVCGMGLCLSPVQGAGEPWEPTGKETPVSMKARTSPINRPKEVGTYYEATVPNTLDLAERARLGLNFATGAISEEYDYEMYWRADFHSYGGGDLWAWPGHMWFQCSPLFACQPKEMEAMAMMRLMSGSQQNLEREAKMMEMMVAHLGDDGLYYVVPSGGRKPWLGPEEFRPYANIHGQARMMRAMIVWYQYTGDPAWKERIDRMVDAWDRLVVVHKDDYAYLPAHGWINAPYVGACYVKGRGWKSTEEPEIEKAGAEEGSLFNFQGHWPGVLANWYLLTGNKQALRLSGELVRFLTNPKFWADWEGGEYPGVVGAEHAHWNGHWHGHVNTIRAILEYAIAANDPQLMLFAREGYEWARRQTMTRTGFRWGSAVGRMIGLAIKLSDSGVGDYWEDVDLYIRNHATEMQIMPEDIPHIQELIGRNPNPSRPRDIVTRAMQPPGDYATGTNVGVIEVSIGAFPLAAAKHGWSLGDAAWGHLGICYAWEGTLRYADGVVRVNLLLNRASPWMDIDSYLPYEGKVVLRNKQAREAFVRVPLYVDTKSVVCRVGDQAARPEWFDRYLRLDSLKAGDVVTIEFPLEARIEQWAGAHGAVYGGSSDDNWTYRFKGNTLIELSPAGVLGEWIYQDRAEKYKLAKAPVKNVTRYVTPQTLKW